MTEERLLNEQLAKALCYKCGGSLSGAKLTPIGKLPSAVVAHTTCPTCKAESVVTLVTNGNGTIPITSDLKPSEMPKFASNKPTSYDDLFELHKVLKKGPLWKLLQKSEQL